MLLLLAMLFSRPFFRDPDALANANRGAVRVVLLDRSASMFREGLWEAAGAHLDEVMSQAKPEDRLAILAFDAGTEMLVDFEEWRQLPEVTRRQKVTEHLEGIDVTWQKTVLDSVLIEAIGLIEDETKGAAGEKENCADQ